MPVMESEPTTVNDSQRAVDAVATFGLAASKMWNKPGIANSKALNKAVDNVLGMMLGRKPTEDEINRSIAW